MAITTAIYHLVGWIHAAYSLYVYHFYITLNPQIDVGFGGQWKYLTYININMQFLFFTLAIMEGLFGLFDHITVSKRLKVMKDVFFASIAAPTCLFIVTSFWIIYSLDREYIYPKYMDNIAPFWTTHFFHTTIISLLLECYMDKVVYPKRQSGLTYMFMFNIMYFIWISYVFFQSGSWPYPFMQLFNIAAFVSFLATVYLIGAGFYVFLEKINKKFHDDVEYHSKTK